MEWPLSSRHDRPAYCLMQRGIRKVNWKSVIGGTRTHFRRWIRHCRNGYFSSLQGSAKAVARASAVGYASSNGADGTLTVVHEDDADHYTVAENDLTLEGA